MDRSDELIDASAAAKLLGVAPLAVREWLKQGRFRALQVGPGGRFKLRRGDVLAYIDARRGQGDEDDARAEPKPDAG